MLVVTIDEEAPLRLERQRGRCRILREAGGGRRRRQNAAENGNSPKMFRRFYCVTHDHSPAASGWIAGRTDGVLGRSQALENSTPFWLGMFDRGQQQCA